MGDMLTLKRDKIQADRAQSVVDILTDWANWMQRDDENHGYPKKSAGFGQCVTPGTFDDMCDHADNLRMQTVDACIGDLPPNQSAAIYRQYLAAVFRMRDFEGSLIAAHDALEWSLRNKGMVW